MSPLAKEILLRWISLRPCAPGAAYELCRGAEAAAKEIEQYEKDRDAREVADELAKEAAAEQAVKDELAALDAAEQKAKDDLAAIEARRADDEKAKEQLEGFIGTQ